MALIIDTMNVLHVTGVLPPDLAGLDVNDLAEIIRLSRYRAQQVTLVCDGRALPGVKAGRAGLTTIRFAGSEQRSRTADDVILEMVNRSSTPRRLLVVSSDHAILRAARRRRCETITSESFLKQIATDVRDAGRTIRPRAHAKPGSSPMSAAQVDKWINIFNADVGAIEKQVEAMQPRKAPAAIKNTEKQAENPPARKSKLRGHMRRIDEHAKTKRGGSTNRTAQANDRDPPKPVLPKDFLAEAEQMVRDYESSRPARTKRTS